MLESYKAVYLGGTGSIEEKKSKFIATVISINTQEEAIEFIEATKKKYWDARHNCYAYVVGMNNEIQRCSDDGEPSQTAGKPMLDVLLGEGIHNVAVVVTRYFGGTLLGTGGLVRAYSKAVQEGLKNSTIIEKILATKINIKTDYNGIGKIQYILGNMGIATLNTEYSDKVELTILVPVKEMVKVTKEITEATSAKAGIEILENVYLFEVDGEIKTFAE